MRKVLLMVCLILGISCLITAQTTPISGVVISEEDNEPIQGVSVQITGTTTRTATNPDGQFSLKNVPDSAATLQVSYPGMQTQEVSIAPNLRIVMKANTHLLKDVEIVVAYGTAKKASLTGSVASINTKAFEERPYANAASLLEGAAPGIQVNNTHGEPGSEPTIRIRGFGSINGSNNPLFVVNGVPYADGVSISDLSPDDIESMTVLKDATSAALYGNRAANGVILITTKKGKSKQSTVRVTVKQGMYTRGTSEYDVVNPYEFMEAMWMGYRNSLVSSNGLTPEAAGEKATKELISNYLKTNIFNKSDDQLFNSNGKLVAGTQILDGYKDDLDWFKAIERTGYRQEYSINGEGASEKGSYFLSLNYLDENGYIKHSDFSRLSARADVTLTPKKWFEMGLQLSGTHQLKNNSNGIASEATKLNNPFNTPRMMAPIYPIHRHDAATGNYLLQDGQRVYDTGEESRDQALGRNIVWERELDKDQTQRNTLTGQVFSTLKFLRDFTFTIRGDLSLIQSENKKYYNATVGDAAGNDGRTNRIQYTYKNYTFQQQLTWRKRLYDRHNVSTLLAHENYSHNSNYLYAMKELETFSGQDFLSNFKQMASLLGYNEDYRTESYLGQIRYNYDEKYFAETSFRRDGSSRFAPGHKWGNFWSAGASWLLTEETFMQPYREIVNTLKIRTSYGEVGNDASVDYYGWMALYLLDQNANTGAAYLVQNENKSLQWETNTSFSLALEGQLLKRLNFTLEYFDKQSKDLLFNVQLPLSAGATSTTSAEASIWKNVGTSSNRGFEISLDYDLIRSRDVTWNVGMNGTVFRNKIQSLPKENREKGIESGAHKLMEGRSIYDFWLYKFVGTDMMTGNALYLIDDEKYYMPGASEAEQEGKTPFPSQSALVEINGNYYTTNTTYGKKDWSGSAIPDFYGAISTSLRWKDLTLSVLGTYSIGGKTLDYTYYSLMQMTGAVHALHKDVVNSWNGVPEGMTETSPERINRDQIPVLDYSKGLQTSVRESDRFLISASYFVIKNITLHYRLPQGFVQKLDLQEAGITASVENVATLTKRKGMNPQQSFDGTSNNAFVTPRIFTMGIHFKF